jgi:site-specific DNA recombinase
LTRLTIGITNAARDDVLIANIARAQQRRSALRNDDLTTIAPRDCIAVRYLGEMLPFTFLSPKLLRAILEGRKPTALTTTWLRRHGLPLSWAEQDRILAQL